MVLVTHWLIPMTFFIFGMDPNSLSKKNGSFGGKRHDGPLPGLLEGNGRVVPLDPPVVTFPQAYKLTTVAVKKLPVK